ncbi:Cbr3, partial [Symbiodinium natans]
ARPRARRGPMLLLWARSSSVSGGPEQGAGRGSGRGAEGVAKGLRPELALVDVADPESVRKCAEMIKERHGGADLVIHNAAARMTPEKTPAEYVRDFVTTNNLGTTEMLRTFLPVMRPGGRLLVIASSFGTLTKLPESLHPKFDVQKSTLEDLDKVMLEYAASVEAGKAAEEGWPDWVNIPSKVGQVAAVKVAAATADAGLFVGGCCPGLVDTAASRPWFKVVFPAGLQREAPCDLDISLQEDASFVVRVAGSTWLESAPLRLFAHGSWHHSAALQQKRLRRYRGEDNLGPFECMNISWEVQEQARVISFHTSLKTYLQSCAAVFVQEVPQGAGDTNASNPALPRDGHELNPGMYPPILNFPALRSSQLDSLGFLLWGGSMAKAVFGRNVTSHLQGLSSGPVALFDSSRATLVVSPMDNFKNSVHFYDVARSTWDLGVSSEVMALPQGFQHRTLMVADTGITRAMDIFGGLLRRAYGTTRPLMDLDPVVNYLSYWTDNGAYYYGDQWHESGGGGETCGEASMKQVAHGLAGLDLLQAVHVWQLDDWWYPGHPAVYVHCVREWVLGQAGFHSSLGDLQKALGKPWLLYVPFFCRENAYTEHFRFINGSHGSTEFALPHPDEALAFYRMLFDFGRANGMKSFEHDFLNFNFLAVPHLRQTFGASRKWLQAMDAAAAYRMVPMQMCMAMPSDLLVSLELLATTNYRASDDYASQANFDIGGSSLLAFALNLRPSKDSFWSQRPASSQETGRPWGPQDNPGSNCELNALIATLSTGPVALADKAYETNRTLLLRCMRPDGLLLQPDKPATAIDAVYMQSLEARTVPPPGLVWATYSQVRGAAKGQIWHYALSIDLPRPWQLQPDDFYPSLDMARRWVVRRWHRNHRPNLCVNGSEALVSGCLLAEIRVARDFPHILDDRPIMVQNDTHRFDLWQFSPVEENGWVFLGEVGKYVSVSSKRFRHVQPLRSGLLVTLVGVRGEEVQLTALKPCGTGWTVLEKTLLLEDSEVSAVFASEPSDPALGGVLQV